MPPNLSFRVLPAASVTPRLKFSWQGAAGAGSSLQGRTPLPPTKPRYRLTPSVRRLRNVTRSFLTPAPSKPASSTDIRTPPDGLPHSGSPADWALTVKPGLSRKNEAQMRLRILTRSDFI